MFTHKTRKQTRTHTRLRARASDQAGKASKQRVPAPANATLSPDRASLQYFPSANGLAARFKRTQPPTHSWLAHFASSSFSQPATAPLKPGLPPWMGPECDLHQGQCLLTGPPYSLLFPLACPKPASILTVRPKVGVKILFSLPVNLPTDKSFPRSTVDRCTPLATYSGTEQIHIAGK
jgi:hypothetical protein